ncbi:hypothetical protein HDK90DRAFT_498029 [Phyllosticta capitalensis]|uniref:Uncharacterized protein n=1 Tax=Phyllosticta capitalensis TaxID=121624 RepID=A0ABR1YBG9_9PEZI
MHFLVESYALTFVARSAVTGEVAVFLVFFFCCSVVVELGGGVGRGLVFFFFFFWGLLSLVVVSLSLFFISFFLSFSILEKAGRFFSVDILLVPSPEIQVDSNLCESSGGRHQ